MRKPSSICPWMSVHSCGSFSPRARHPKRVPIRVLLNDYALETHRGSRPANATAIRKKLDNDGISRASPKAVWLHGRQAETRHRSIPQPGIGVIRAMPPRVYIFRHLLQRLGVGSIVLLSAITYSMRPTLSAASVSWTSPGYSDRKSVV